MPTNITTAIVHKRLGGRGVGKQKNYPCALILHNNELENVAIANALQLEAARRRAVPIRFNFAALAQSIRCRFRAFLLLIRYVTL